MVAAAKAAVNGISIDFVGSGTAMAATETAGVAPKANWNAATGASSSTPLALRDEDGSTTAATVVWSSDNTWITAIADTAGDARMMKGYLDNGSLGNTVVTVANLPASVNGYDIYVYVDGANYDSIANRTGNYQISGDGITTQTQSATDNGNTDFSGSFTQGTNYVKFTIHATGFTLTAIPGAAGDPYPRAPVNGIQIVPAAAMAVKGISIDFVGSGTAMAGTETAGVASKANWNAATGASNSTPLALRDEDGSTTAATVVWSSDNTWITAIADTAGDARMMKGYLDNGSAGNTVVTVANLPASVNGYDIYVYVDSANYDSIANRTGNYQISGDGITTQTQSATDNGNTDFSGSFTQGTNYVKFTIHATGFTLTAIPGAAGDPYPRAPVNGIQIVPGGVAPPSFTPAPGAYTAAQTVTISTTTPGASIRYTTDGSTPSETAGTLYSGPITVSSTSTIKAIAYLSGGNDSAVASATYTIAAAVGNPSFTPAGGTYASAQTVAISTTTPGASIRYTTDGSTPTETAGTLYNGPITVSNTTTIKAIGYLSGGNDSAVASATYTITGTVANPSFTPAAGTYPSAQTVTISTTTPGASIRYTTDGSTPSETAGALYNGPITVSNTTTIKAIGYLSGWTNSIVASAAYSISSGCTGSAATGKDYVRLGTRIVAIDQFASDVVLVAGIVSTPSGPAGPTSGVPGASYTYTTNGSMDSCGNSVQYRFNWGDGTDSGWLQAGTNQASHTWALGGTYDVVVQARSAVNRFVVSGISAGFAVAVQCGVPVPSSPTGPASGQTGTSYTYNAGGLTDGCGDPVQYRFDWGDGTDSGWLQAGTTQALHTWTSGGTYNVTTQARSTINTSIVSGVSAGLAVVIQSSAPPPISVVQSASGTNVYTEPAWWEGTLSISQAFNSDNTAENTIIVAAGVQQLNTQHATAPVTVTDTQGNTYTQVFWVPSGTDDGPALGFFIASGIKAGANTVTVSYTASQAPYTTNFTNYIAIAEYQGLDTPTIQTSATEQRWVGSTPAWQSPTVSVLL